MADDTLIPPTPSAEAYAVDEDQGPVFTHDDPFDLFKAWLGEARGSEPNDPNAMALATAGADGRPDVRIVLLKDISEGGLTFYSSRLSAKGREISENAAAALCFHWKTIRRQVRFRGDIRETSAAEADAYFATRARGAQIGAHASDQSEAMPADDALRRAVAQTEAAFDGETIPRPDYWTGFRLIPLEIEFWVNRPYRLHDRLAFRREAPEGDWRTERLYP